VAMFLNDTSQFMMHENMEDNCRKYWWRNLLMIQNFYPISQMCMSWSWYVSVDFQLAVVVLILLVVWRK
jgi:hypothetical protein